VAIKKLPDSVSKEEMVKTLNYLMSKITILERKIDEVINEGYNTYKDLPNDLDENDDENGGI